MKIGFIGCGVVGGTLIKWMNKHTRHTLRAWDPPLGLKESLSGCDAIFISVPVPAIPGGQDLTTLKECVLYAKQFTNNVFIRSTVLPGTNDMLGTIAMPEFLTERRAYEDFCALPVLLGHNDADLDGKKLFPGKHLVFLSNVECELAKFTHNCFGAMKVTYFNIIEELSRMLGADFENVKQGAFMTGFIEETHTHVPGPDGQRGFGGKCFPENIKAMKYYLNSAHIRMTPAATFFQSIHNLNLMHRAAMTVDTVIEEFEA